MAWLPCKHVELLAIYLKANQLQVWGEFQDGPFAMNNVYCKKCDKTYETNLNRQYHQDDDEGST